MAPEMTINISYRYDSESMAANSGARACDVSGCSKEAERSISLKQVKATKLSLKPDCTRSAHLCRDHYREFKKETKKDRKFEQLGY
jgi:uncharacterized Zn-finger protein